MAWLELARPQRHNAFHKQLWDEFPKVSLMAVPVHSHCAAARRRLTRTSFLGAGGPALGWRPCDTCGEGGGVRGSSCSCSCPHSSSCACRGRKAEHAVLSVPLCVNQRTSHSLACWMYIQDLWQCGPALHGCDSLPRRAHAHCC